MTAYCQQVAGAGRLALLFLFSLSCCFCPFSGLRYPEERPITSDVVGTYRLTDQTLTRQGVDVLEGALCEIELRADGTFLATNFPLWMEVRPVEYELDELTHLEGRWDLRQVGSISHNWGLKPIWGIHFSGAMGSAQLVGQGPYSLCFVYGDPDDADEMIFTRVR